MDPAQIRLLEPQKIKSLLQCLIQDRGRPRGYIGFDECREKRLWDQEQINVLTYVAEILSVFLLKKRAEDRIQQLESSLKVKWKETPAGGREFSFLLYPACIALF